MELPEKSHCMSCHESCCLLPQCFREPLTYMHKAGIPAILREHPRFYQGTLSESSKNWWRCLIKPLCTLKFKNNSLFGFDIVNSQDEVMVCSSTMSRRKGNVTWGLNSQARCWGSFLSQQGLSPPSLTPLLYICHWPRSPSVLGHSLSSGPFTPSFQVQTLIWSNLISFSFPIFQTFPSSHFERMPEHILWLLRNHSQWEMKWVAYDPQMYPDKQFNSFKN